MARGSQDHIFTNGRAQHGRGQLQRVRACRQPLAGHGFGASFAQVDSLVGLSRCPNATSQSISGRGDVVQHMHLLNLISFHFRFFGCVVWLMTYSILLAIVAR